MTMQTSTNVRQLRNHDQLTGNWPRYLNALIAVWLFISAFAWRHTMPLRQDTWIVALLMFITALVAMTVSSFRWVNTALAVWLVISTLAFPHTMAATEWNNLIVAIAVFLLSLVPSSRETQKITSPTG